MSWLSRRYTIAVIDSELRQLVQERLDMRRDDPRRILINERIDVLLEQRTGEVTRGEAA